MVGIDTEKVFATSTLGVPASTAESTLSLRSFEYGFMEGGYHTWIDTYGCRCKAFGQNIAGLATMLGPVFGQTASGSAPLNDVVMQEQQAFCGL